MDYKALALDAWRIARRSRPLWWLGLVSAAQLVVYAAIMAATVGPMLLLPQLVVAPRTSATPAETQLQVLRERVVFMLTDWLAVHGAALIAGAVVAFGVWLVLGVFDVASQGGLISQADKAAHGRTASFRSGMRDGFRGWWRVMELLAVAALPSLVSMLATALVMLFTVTVPLLRGVLPDPMASLAGNAALSPLSSLAAVVAIPLGVIVQLGMRDAMLADADWKTALREGWGLVKARPAEVVAVYLLMIAVGVGATIVAGVVLGIVAVPTFAVVFALAAGPAAARIAAAVSVIGVLSLIVVLPFAVLNYVWNSCVWTLFWRRTAGSRRAGLQ